MYFDFHHMEVSVLQWLAHDERLGQVLNLSEDPYHVIFKLLTGNQCDTEKKREFCKRFIIGNIYGQSAKSLSEKTGISLNTAEIINDKLYKLFPSSLQWIQQRQNEVTGVCTDYFGRKRCFEERHWSVRNFVVQSPASIVCLEKLIALYHGLIGYAKLACHIHDGYVVYVSKSAAKTVAAIGKEILESESNLCTGLKLKSSCKIGATLADMKACEV
jgi:DNA polymerase I-like protein with 3'-5' exonuclease and polymerase domains